MVGKVRTMADKLGVRCPGQQEAWESIRSCRHGSRDLHGKLPAKPFEGVGRLWVISWVNEDKNWNALKYTFSPWMSVAALGVLKNHQAPCQLTGTAYGIAQEGCDSPWVKYYQPHTRLKYHCAFHKAHDFSVIQEEIWHGRNLVWCSGNAPESRAVS